MPFSVRADRRLIRDRSPQPPLRRRRDRRPGGAAAGRSDPRQPRLRHRPLRAPWPGDKIQKAREAAIQGIRALRPEDRFAVVAYDDHVDVVVPSTPATAEAPGRGRSRESPSSTIAAARTCTRAGSPAARRSAAALARRRRGPLPAPDRRPRQRGRHGPRRDRRAGGGPPAAAGSPPPPSASAPTSTRSPAQPHRRGGRRELPLHRGRVADPRVHRGPRSARRSPITARDVVLVVEAGEGALVESLNDFPCTPRETPGASSSARSSAGRCSTRSCASRCPGGPEGATREVRVRARRPRRRPRPPERAPSRFTWAGHAENDRPGARPPRGSPRRVPLRRAGGPRGAARTTGRGDFAGRAPRPRALPRAGSARYAGDDPETAGRSSATSRSKVEPYSASTWTPIALQVRPLRRATLRLKSRRAGARPQPPRASPSSSCWPPPASSAVVRRRSRAPRPADPALFSDAAVRRPRPRAAAPSGPPPLAGRRDRPRLRDAPVGRARAPFVSSSRTAAWATTGSRTGTSCAVPRSSRWPTGTARSPSRPRPSPPTRSSSTRLRLLGLSFAPEKLMHDETARLPLRLLRAAGATSAASCRPGALCDPCRQALTTAGIPSDRVLNLLNAIRLLAATPPAVH